MRRSAALCALFAVVAAGSGCKHVAGVCDCTAHPDDGVIYAPANPYPTFPVHGAPVAPADAGKAPAKMPAADPMGK